MNLERAIEILTDCQDKLANKPSTDIYKATSLGIEALKWRKLMELDYGSWCGPPLPGEAKD